MDADKFMESMIKEFDIEFMRGEVMKTAAKAGNEYERTKGSKLMDLTAKQMFIRAAVWSMYHDAQKEMEEIFGDIE